MNTAVQNTELVVASYGDLKLPSGSLPSRRINAKSKFKTRSMVRLERIDDAEIQRVVAVSTEQLTALSGANPVLLRSNTGRRFKGLYNVKGSYSLDDTGLLAIVTDTKRKSIAFEATK
jgi:hypothetical protein